MNDRTGEVSDADETLAGSPGGRLRQAREAAGLELIEVAAQLNVRPQLIEALEADDVSAFPAQVYARGLLRNYARLLGLDVEPLLLLHAEMAGLDAPPLDSVRKVDGASRGARGGPWFPLLVIAVLVLLLAYALYRFNEGGPEKGVPTSTVPSQAGGPPAQGRGREEIQAQGEGVSPSVPSEAAEAPVRGVTSAREPGGQAPEDEPVAVDDELLLIFDADSWVEVRDAQGQRLLTRTGKAGQQLRLRGRAPFDVRLGYAPGVRIEYNGRPFAGPAARKSRVAHFQVGTQRP